MIKYIVKADVKEQLAKDYLKRHENISSTLWKKIKRQDEFFVNGQKVRATQAIVKPNDIIEYNLPATSKVEAIQIPLNIVFEDDYFLIVDKIAGMLTHPLTFENTQTLANGVMYHFAKTNQNVGCHPLYRLDRNTSGLVVFAKMPQLQHQLANNHQKFQR
ncbi:pseudouridine synthase, partial [uncultured Megamonas sp.]